MEFGNKHPNKTRFFADFEFNSYQGQVLSVGLVSDSGAALYAVFPFPKENEINPWVRANVVPIINSVPAGIPSRHMPIPKFQELLTEFLLAPRSLYPSDELDDYEIEIITDWPDDVKYLSELLITGPGKMIDIPGISFKVVRVDPYVSPPKGAVQHNAMWDAIALRFCLTGESECTAFKPSAASVT